MQTAIKDETVEHNVRQYIHEFPCNLLCDVCEWISSLYNLLKTHMLSNSLLAENTQESRQWKFQLIVSFYLPTYSFIGGKISFYLLERFIPLLGRNDDSSSSEKPQVKLKKGYISDWKSYYRKIDSNFVGEFIIEGASEAPVCVSCLLILIKWMLTLHERR